MARTSKIYLAKNIKLDKNYRAVLNYSESDMISLITNNANLVYYQANYQFIRESNVIQIKAPYSQVCGANYMAFQNPDYSNKYFFAFIDDIKYLSENSTEIRYTIDVWTTWYDYWNAKACYVVREHVSDDTIGLHTVPENLETGDIINSTSVDYGTNICHAVVVTTQDPFDSGSNYPYNQMNGIPSGYIYFLVGNFTSVNFIGWLRTWAATNSTLDVIQGIYLVPDLMTGYKNAGDTGYSDFWSYALNTGGLSYAPYHKFSASEVASAINMGAWNITKPYTSIDSYVPSNNKLFCYPYNYLMLDNNGGACYEYRYEDFSDENCVFNVYGDITPGCSIKAIPYNYKKITSNLSEGISACKYPIGSWSGDVYTNWLTQNGLNIGTSLGGGALGILGGIGSIMAGAVPTGAGMIASSVMGIANTVNEVNKHSKIPDQVSGNSNAGDVIYSMGKSTFTAYKRCIRSEYAKIIDEYFKRQGYKINRIKVPNLSGRQNFNYVQIANDDNVAYPNDHNNICVPATALNDINNLFRSGVTIWNNHANLGDYSVSNNIVTPTTPPTTPPTTTPTP